MAHDVAVVIVPFPAHGHLNQLLNLSLLLFARGLAIHYATSPSHIPPGPSTASKAGGPHPSTPSTSTTSPSLPSPPLPRPQRRHQIPQPPAAPLGIHSPPPLSSRLSTPPSAAASSSSTTPSSRSPPRRPPPSTTPWSTASTASRPSSTPPGDPKKSLLARNQSISNASLISQSFDDCFTNEFLDFFAMNQALLDSVAAAGSLSST